MIDQKVPSVTPNTQPLGNIAFQCCEASAETLKYPNTAAVACSLCPHSTCTTDLLVTCLATSYRGVAIAIYLGDTSESKSGSVYAF